jgi:hypothetical protein
MGVNPLVLSALLRDTAADAESVIPLPDNVIELPDME